VMLTLREIYGGESTGSRPKVSVEIFPPKTEDGDRVLFENLDRLAEYSPSFISCTYGAGGSTRDRTLDLCREISTRYATVATAHLTCVGATRAELIEWIGSVRAAGINNIMALRGDPPRGADSFTAVSGGLQHGNELVELIRSESDLMGIGVAAYPEVHPESPDAASDLENLKRKIDAGADAAFTQLFYINDNFLRFRDRYHAAGIEVPLVPGIMPITEFSRIQRIASLCGAKIPVELAERLESVQDDREAQLAVGVEYAVAQCLELIAEGVPGLHFYALNRSHACARILEQLGHGVASGLDENRTDETGPAGGD
jgi:methylenetetrahydrofolate reductase (NADPH)